MAYIEPAAFRASSVEDFSKGLELTDTEATDDQLTAAIERVSRRLESRNYFNDHFEHLDGLVFDLSPRGNSDRLYLPRRVRTVTNVKTRDPFGLLTTEDPDTYRVTSSFVDVDQADEVDGGRDCIEIAAGRRIQAPPGIEWPAGAHTVQVTGDFGWNVAPFDVKRAVAIMVYDHFKPINDQIRRSERWESEQVIYSRSTSSPTGLAEVDEIIAAWRRSPRVGVA